MRTPLRPIPEHVLRWTRRARRLRWLDAFGAWVAVWVLVSLLAPDRDPGARGVVAALLTGAGGIVPGLRRRWRPASALTALVLGWRLRPGDRAWQVWPGGARPVLVTSGRWATVVVAGVVQDSGEGIVLPRTRALLIPASRDRR